MTYTFSKMKQEEAEEIAYQWHYDGEYSFYNMEEDKEDLEEFLNEETHGVHTYSVFLGEALIGFFTWTDNEKGVNISLGMHPDHTGRGEGGRFVEDCLRFLDNPVVTLDVALFNKRAISVYKKEGFREVYRFTQETNGDIYPFVHMIRESPAF